MRNVKPISSSGQHRQRNAFYTRFAFLAPLRAARFTAFLFALLQIIAPTWHVCEMSGRCEHCLPHGHTEVFIPPKCGGGKLCKCEPKAYPPSTTFADADTRPDAFEGTCLARELRAMAAHGSALLQLDVRIVRVSAPLVGDIVLLDLQHAPLPPARAPPVVSL